MKFRSNQFECKKCGNRKFKIFNRKNANVCDCGAMMVVYEKKRHIPLPEISINYVPMGFIEEEQQGISLGDLIFQEEEE